MIEPGRLSAFNATVLEDAISSGVELASTAEPTNHSH